MPGLRPLIRTVLILLIIISGFAASHQPEPLDVAKTYCAGRGIPLDHLALRKMQGSRGLLASKETIEFAVEGDPARKGLVLELQQPVYFLRWRVRDFREIAPLTGPPHPGSTSP